MLGVYNAKEGQSLQILGLLQRLSSLHIITLKKLREVIGDLHTVKHLVL